MTRPVEVQDVMVVILTLHSNTLPQMVSKPNLLIHTLERTDLANTKQEPNIQQVFQQYPLPHWRLPLKFIQSQSLLMLQTGVHIQKEPSATVLSHWTTLSLLSDMMPVEIGLSRTLGELLGELKDSSLSLLEILAVLPNTLTRLSEVFYLHHNNTK